jgi:rifampicin phosphotransferase
MGKYVKGFEETDKTKIAVVGGKGANLGELSKVEGIQVPDGFCVTTEAYQEIIENNPEVGRLLEELVVLTAAEREQISETSTKIRMAIEGVPMPGEIAAEIAEHLKGFGVKNAFAVRSSATAEDLPTASFAGQQDTYLNIMGEAEILKHVRKCWASLFTERAVTYRIRNGFDHHKVHLAVVVQKMVFPEAAGILFTADPITSNRKVSSVDASFGLGEAVVSGLVNADNYKVRGGKVIDKKIGIKQMAVEAMQDGGTTEREIKPGVRDRQVLTDAQIVQLEHIGRKIEAHFGSPQDIEWCWVEGKFYIVQSRPITTLYPIPEAKDQENHVYVSVGHGQMMTDPMRPLGLSVWQLTTARPMFPAGGRLFVDITQELASPARRGMVVEVMGKSDPLIKDALLTIMERGDFLPSLPDEPLSSQGNKPMPPPHNFQTLNSYDPTIVAELIQRSEGAVATLKLTIQTKSGTDLMDFILVDIQELKKSLADPQSFGVIMTAMNAAAWLNEKMLEWLGEKNVSDSLSQSLTNNITSEMGLALLDVADALRPWPAVITYLQHTDDEHFLHELAKVDGGVEARNAILTFLEKYGMRCAGEIDITNVRWIERPVTLVPIILNHIKNLTPGESKRKFQQGLEETSKKEAELLVRLQQLPDGAQKAEETKRMIDLVRSLAGYREYPKYGIVSRYYVYKQALLREADSLVRAHVIHDKEDIYHLSFEELREVVRTHQLNGQIIQQRKEAHKLHERLSPPRVITSDGEIITGEYRRENLPAGALVGLPVSSGVIEGRARVILKMENAELEAGAILVTAFTDPSWTPLFVSIKGLVTEVGGLMTHGAVIAREYGLPAVVGVENATKLIQDGQHIRVNGTDGYIEFL